MKSYSTGLNLAQTFTKNESSDNQSFLAEVANDDYRALCAMHDWPWLERRRTKKTVADTASVDLPYDCDKVRAVAVVVSDQRYTPREVPSREFWDELNMYDTTSDIPEWWYVFDEKLYLWPTPSTSDNDIYITQKTKVIDLNIADYSTGNIETATNGSSAIVGSGTSWNSSMVGKWIRITNTSSAGGGDGQWYEISAVGSTTTLTLVRDYGGTSISGGSADYTIAQMPLLPDGFHDMPWLWAAGMYWDKEADSRADRFFAKHGQIGGGSTISTGKVAELEKSWRQPTSGFVLDDGGDDGIINPNLTISL